jgi:hypothetical protein
MGIRPEDVIGLQPVYREQNDGSGKKGYGKHRPGILYQEPFAGTFR